MAVRGRGGAVVLYPEVLCGSAGPQQSRRALPGGAVWQCRATAEPSCSTLRCCGVAVRGHGGAVVLYP